jgi:CRP-like cAMP-binding protein
MPLVHHREKVKEAIQRGDLFSAAHSLAALCKLQPNDLELALMHADLCEQAGSMNDEAAEAYARASRLSVDTHDWRSGGTAMVGYYRLRPDGKMLGRELFHRARANDALLAEAMTFLHQDDCAAFAMHEHPMFSSLSDILFDEVFTSLQAQALDDGEFLVRKGDPAKHLFVITEGSLEPWVEDDDGTFKPMAVIEAGSITGETPFLTDTSERTADLKAVGKTQVYLLPYHVLHALVEKHPTIRHQMEAFHQQHAPERQLAFTPFFQSISAQERRNIAQEMEIICLPAGTNLCTIDERKNLDFYVVHAGWLSVNTSINGRERLLYTAKRHNLLGELGLLENRRKITVRTISDVQLLRWPEDRYRHYYQNNEWLRFKLADRLLHLNKKVHSLA